MSEVFCTEVESGPANESRQGLAIYYSDPPERTRTLLDILEQTAANHPNATALDDGQQLSYVDCARAVEAIAARLRAVGIGAGDRVGIRVPSGCADLYLGILAVLATGAAYVPVDAEDPEERAGVIWQEAGVCAVLGQGLSLTLRHGVTRGGRLRRPTPDDDAWIIFTSGSTGRPKGVAVTHGAAAAFVDAEAELFLSDDPLGPEDRILAGLSVAFDASCEEMWLAWRHGACLVPAPRRLVRAGVELGPWLLERGITVVSTVPTLATLWPVSALDRVRLLIFGGEACPPELVDRLSGPRRELWNTYGPTETTVVACAAPLRQAEPVRIGLPLRGWQLAVLDPNGRPVREGELGELVISGVGRGRYLDPMKDSEKFRPVPALGWTRAYHSGDLVSSDGAGLVFVGRADDQIKMGGRRIELGEIDAALLSLSGVTAAAAAVRRTQAGSETLVGYLAVSDQPGLDHEGGIDLAAARERLAERLPAALIPLLTVVDTIPTRTSGKIDRSALPWPLPGSIEDDPGSGCPTADAPGTTGWLARIWLDLLGVRAEPGSDFFALGGTSLAVARLVSVLRERHPTVSVADVYRHPVLRALSEHLDLLARFEPAARREPAAPTRQLTSFVQLLILVLSATITGLRWVAGLALLHNLSTLLAMPRLLGPPVPWWTLGVAWLLLFSAPGRLASVTIGARLLRRGITAGSHPRGGRVHLQLWAAERLASVFSIRSLSGTPWAAMYARAMGCQVGSDVDLRSTTPITGMAVLGDGCTIESEADLAGWWLDGDTLHIGEMRIGAEARIGARSTILPGARIGAGSVIEPGSCVDGSVPGGEVWSGSPAERIDLPPLSWPAPRHRRSLGWNLVYTLSLFGLGIIPILAAIPGLVLIGYAVRNDDLQPDAALWHVLAVSPLTTVVSVLTYMLLIAVALRLAGRGLRPGFHSVHSCVGWCAWLTERLMVTSRVALFPLYASLATPFWLRRLGARVGRHVEASTVLGLPRLMRVEDGSFLADDALVSPYEIRSGWLHLGESTIGRRAFAGNSSIIGPGRQVPDEALIAVLSTAPVHARAGTSWMGRPPIALPRVPDGADPARTFDPPARLVLARALVESLRVLPWMISAALGMLVLGALEAAQRATGWTGSAFLGGIVLLAAGSVACLITTSAKWLLVGRFRAAQHPLWSSFVWRNELFDVFYEELALPWLAGAVRGTPLLNLWLRTLGARIGRGVWCETHWLPETDLIQLDDGVTVNRGCVLQTHLFHDRLMRIDGVHLGAGATLGPNSIVLPGASIGPMGAVGAGSVVARGEAVPGNTRWVGNPVIAVIGHRSAHVGRVGSPSIKQSTVAVPPQRMENATARIAQTR